MKLTHLQILVKTLVKIPDITVEVNNPYQAKLVYRGDYYHSFEFELQESRQTYPANKKAAILSWQFTLIQDNQPEICRCYREVEIAELPALAEELVKTLQTYCLTPPGWEDLEDCDCTLSGGRLGQDDQDDNSDRDSDSYW